MRSSPSIIRGATIAVIPPAGAAALVAGIQPAACFDNEMDKTAG